MLIHRGKNVLYLASNQRGVALLLVMSSIALLTWLLADFTFETHINKIKTYNAQDRLQAQLNAQAGLNFALAKLRLYKEARNLLEKNESFKNVVKPREVEGMVLIPFRYPLPLPANAGLIQKNAVQEFTENTFIKGEISVSITPVRGFLNPNNLRFVPASNDDENETPDRPEQRSATNSENDRDDDENGEKKSIQQSMEEKLVELVASLINRKREEDDIFDQLYGSLEPEFLVKELKYYVNNPNLFQDPEKDRIERLYSDKETTPKHAPLNSIDELYLLAGWPDDIVNLVKDHLSVHEISAIVINEITEDQLRVIFPELDDIQIEEFFRYRDGDSERQEEPNPFESEEDFKNFLTGPLGLSEQNYDDRAEDLASAGLRFDTVGNLYKVVSLGSFERANYKLTAFIKMPMKPRPKETPTRAQDRRRTGPSPANPPNQNPPPEENEQNEEKKKPPQEFMEPRVVELRLG